MLNSDNIFEPDTVNRSDFEEKREIDQVEKRALRSDRFRTVYNMHRQEKADKLIKYKIDTIKKI